MIYHICHIKYHIRYNISYDIICHIMSYINSYQLSSYDIISHMISYHIIYPAIHHTICHVTYVISCHITYCVVPLWRGQFYHKYSQRHPMARPLRRGMDSASDWYHVSIPAIFNAKSFYIGPRFNGTRLYNAISYIYIIYNTSYIYHSIYHINYQILYHILYHTMHHIIYHICHISLTSQRTCYLVDKGWMNLLSTQELGRCD